MTAPTAEPTVAVVTPARDEERHIASTIASVVGQSHRPVAWVVVDDRSTDRTAEVVERAIADVPWITLIRRTGGVEDGFASKVHAFRAGLAALDGVDHELVANLDADVSLPPDYFDRLTAAFAADPGLGVAGGRIAVEVDGHVEQRRTSADAVAGAVQCFRRTCFEEIGGIPALRRGGEDAAAQITARAKGWTVRTLDDLEVIHHGPVLNRHRSALRAFWSRGIVNRGLGYDPLFQALAAAYRGADRPYVIGGAALLGGYAWAAARREPRSLPDDVVDALRREQRARVRSSLRRG